MVLWTLQWHNVSWLHIGWVQLDVVSVEVCLSYVGIVSVPS
jgi:hypothetical protein